MLPLIASSGPSVFARLQGSTVSRAEFLQQTLVLAATLPDRPYVINLAGDRYRFALGLCAALLRGQVTLLPANRASGALQRLWEQYPDCYGLGGSQAVAGELPWQPLDPPTGCMGTTAVPMIPGQQTAAVVFTSGSTGEARPQLKSWAALYRVGEQIKRRFNFDTVNVLATVPCQHMYGLETSVCLPLANAGSFHASQPLFPADISRTLQELPAPRLLVTTPIHLRAVLLANLDLPPLQSILSATAPLPKHLAAAVEERYATPVYEIYGFSEAGSVATRRTIGSTRWQLLEGLQLQTDVADALFLHADYLPAPVPFPDIVTRTGPDLIELHGRGTDLVNIAGHRASLQDLNGKLQTIAGVQDGVFIAPARDDERPDARLQAFVVAPGYSSDYILAALRQLIDPAFLPRPLFLVPELPRDATGKLPQATVARLLHECSSRMPDAVAE